MKIKKPTVMKAPGAGAATGGAAIAERFRLDNIEAEVAGKAQRGTIGKGEEVYMELKGELTIDR